MTSRMQPINKQKISKYLAIALISSLAISSQLSTVSYAADFAGSLKGVTITDSGGTNLPPTAVINFTQNGNSIGFDAGGSIDDGSISVYRWDFGDGITGTGATINHLFAEPGNYPVTLTVVDNEGGVALTQVEIVNASSQEINVLISNGDDDAEESATGSVILGSSDLELVRDGSEQIVGLRFSGVGIPPQAKIFNAYVEFETDETGTLPTSLVIATENSGNALPFASISNNISNRPIVGSSVVWENVPEWNTVSEKHQTPDISELIQAVVSRPDWSTGNSIAIIIKGTGRRTAESYDGEKTGAAMLHVEFQ